MSILYSEVYDGVLCLDVLVTGPFFFMWKIQLIFAQIDCEVYIAGKQPDHVVILCDETGWTSRLCMS